MIVLNPPSPPAHLQLITTTAEEQAVETAIRVARVAFRCQQNVDAVEWLRVLKHYGPDTTFVLDLPSGTSIALCEGSGGENTPGCMVVDGAAGVLDLAAQIAMYAEGL